MGLKAQVKKRSRNASDHSNLGARQALLKAGLRLFAHHGLKGTSIRDIAKEAGLNSSLISYYFDSKEGLYRACLREISEEKLTLTNEILQPPKDRAEFELRLKMFIQSLIAALLDDREVGLIVIREYDRVNSPAEKGLKASFFEGCEGIKG